LSSSIKAHTAITLCTAAAAATAAAFIAAAAALGTVIADLEVYCRYHLC
jgi:hypothetical protein